MVRQHADTILHVNIICAVFAVRVTAEKRDIRQKLNIRVIYILVV